VVLATLAVLAAAITIQSPAPVQALAADGPRVAYAAGFSARDCNRVYVWDLRTRRTARLGRRTHCERTSTGNRISQLGLAGNRALWLHYVGGNRRLYSLWTATTARRLPTRIASREVDVDDPPPFVVGEGDGDLLPYAAGATVTALRANGSRAFRWRAPARVTALGAGGGRLAAATADGSVTVLDASGRILQELTVASAGAVEITAAKVTAGGVAVQHGRVVVHWRSSAARTFTVPAGARLQDALGSSAVLAGRAGVQRLDLRSGTVSTLGAGAWAQLEPGRVVTASGRTVTARPG
jgi:hypothetical protein